MLVETRNQNAANPGAKLADQVRQLLVEEMRTAIAQENWERLAILIDSYSQMSN